MVGRFNLQAARLAAGAIGTAIAVSVLTCAGTVSAWSDEQPMFMFVQSAEDLKVDAEAKTLTLVNLNPQTIFFADRPERIAGHIKLDKYMEEWTSKAGADNFKADPPNASLSVYEPSSAENVVSIVEISDPRIDGSNLTYTYKLLDGKLPAGGGATSLFIDWIGVGGGVGVGYHGVGVGFRGPGLR